VPCRTGPKKVRKEKKVICLMYVSVFLFLSKPTIKQTDMQTYMQCSLPDARNTERCRGAEMPNRFGNWELGSYRFAVGKFEVTKTYLHTAAGGITSPLLSSPSIYPSALDP
jgi:hypothetical protein